MSKHVKNGGADKTAYQEYGWNEVISVNSSSSGQLRYRYFGMHHTIQICSVEDLLFTPVSFKTASGLANAEFRVGPIRGKRHSDSRYLQVVSMIGGLIYNRAERCNICPALNVGLTAYSDGWFTVKVCRLERYCQLCDPRIRLE
jgi:hypothetical protein